jgi:hypothetical protein
MDEGIRNRFARVRLYHETGDAAYVRRHSGISRPEQAAETVGTPKSESSWANTRPSTTGCKFTVPVGCRQCFAGADINHRLKRSLRIIYRTCHPLL